MKEFTAATWLVLRCARDALGATDRVDCSGLPSGSGAEKRERGEETLGGVAILKGAWAPLALTSMRELMRRSLRFSEGKSWQGKWSR